MFDLRRGAIASLVLVISACGDPAPGQSGTDLGSTDTDPDTVASDADGDGYSVEDGDCDDADMAVGPAAAEVCNEIDDDCDGLVDDDDPILFGGLHTYLDADGDGHGDVATHLGMCVPSPERVGIGDDCDDAEAAMYPGAALVPCDGLDNDCDPETPEVGRVSVGGTEFPSIYSALESLPSGGTVDLCEGTYLEHDLVLRDHIVRGLGAPEITVVDAEGDGRVFRVESSAMLEGLTVRGGDADDGGGLHLSSVDELLLRDVVITGNTAVNGGGIFAEDLTTLTLERVDVVDNTAGTAGGGAFVGNGVAIVSSDSSFDRNHADAYGGGIRAYDTLFFDGGGTTTVSDNVARESGNGWNGSGGGLYVGYNLDASGLEIAGNDADNGGGGLSALGGGSLVDSIVTGNEVFGTAYIDGSGGGVSVGAVFLMERVEITANEVAGSGGGVAFGSDLTLVDCILTDNIAGMDGGAASSGAGAGALLDVTLESVDSDWGVGATDNSPADLYFLALDDTFRFDGVVSFTCGSDTGC